MRPTRVLVLAAVAVLGALTFAPGAATANETRDSAGRFIVTLEDGVDSRSTAAEYHRRDGAQVDHVYGTVLNGFAGDFSHSALGDLQRDGRVARIERDGIARATAVTSWGLDRIDQKYLALDNTYNGSGTGSGVHAYVIDTGIYAGHNEFAGRMGAGADYVDDPVNGNDDPDDCNGHGTHVAGTIGGTTFGVAPGVILHGVRVLNCSGSGTWSAVIDGMDWVAVNAPSGSVANMSLGGGANSSVDAAANNLANRVTLAVAAGNSSANACNYSPARAANALTVGATTSTDARASYSNYGSCLDLFAPGSNITSAWIDSVNDTNTISGTSMASPHVAGIAALLAGGRTPQQVRDAIVGQATAGVVANAGSYSPNRLLFNGSTVPHAPTVSLARSCGKSSCTFTATGRDPDGDAPMTFTWTNAISAAASKSTSFGKATDARTKNNQAGSYTVSVQVTAGGASSAIVSLTTNCVKQGSRTVCR